MMPPALTPNSIIESKNNVGVNVWKSVTDNRAPTASTPRVAEIMPMNRNGLSVGRARLEIVNNSSHNFHDDERQQQIAHKLISAVLAAESAKMVVAEPKRIRPKGKSELGDSIPK